MNKIPAHSSGCPLERYRRNTPQLSAGTCANGRAGSVTYDPAALTQPIFFIGTRRPFDAIVASPGAEWAFHSTAVHAALGPIMFSDCQLANHPSIATRPGAFLGHATAWLEDRVRGDTTAATAFTGSHPELLSIANWPRSAVK